MFSLNLICWKDIIQKWFRIGKCVLHEIDWLEELKTKKFNTKTHGVNIF
jgi:hypothetical protein